MMALAIQKFAVALCYTIKKDWIFEHLRLYVPNDGQDWWLGRSMMAPAIQKFAIALCYTVKKDWIFGHLRLYAPNDGQDWRYLRFVW